MQQRIIHGAVIDALTADELVTLLPQKEQKTRMRVPASVVADAAGNARATDVFKIPVGYDFEARRVVLTLTGNAPSDPANAPFLLGAGKWIAYLRSGSLIEYGQPQYATVFQIPGVQTWGDEQGPYLRNGEVFGIQAAGLPANASLDVYLEGILRVPSSDEHA